jgi:hypothetical protein
MTMQRLPTILPVIALAAVAAAPSAYADQPDLTKADRVICTPARMARCKTDGSCTWRNANARQKAQPLVIDFKTRKAVVRYQNKERPFGIVVEDKTDGDARRIVISRDAKRDPVRTIVFTLNKAGKLTGTRLQGRVKIEATCAAS